MARKRRMWPVLLLGLVAGGVAGGLWFRSRLAPTEPGPDKLVRYGKPRPIGVVLLDLQKRGVVRDARAANLYARLTRRSSLVGTGTYRFRPGSTLDEVFAELGRPIRQMVRLPETNWAARNARILEREGVCSATAYLAAVRDPARFASAVSFPLPKDTLEGYLYPDTYDLPPLLGADEVVTRQLRNFERRVWEGLDRPANLDRLLKVASLVELEVKLDEERPLVAGVIENRVRKGMRLQIDAAINYGIQKWRPLTYRDYRESGGAYNLYRNDGLPPTPICSPTVKSIRAAMAPARHDDLYYVALPDGRSLFAPDYPTHLKNVAKRRAAMR